MYWTISDIIDCFTDSHPCAQMQYRRDLSYQNLKNIIREDLII